jgi:hypothetical protein
MRDARPPGGGNGPYDSGGDGLSGGDPDSGHRGDRGDGHNDRQKMKTEVVRSQKRAVA